MLIINKNKNVFNITFFSILNKIVKSLLVWGISASVYATNDKLDRLIVATHVEPPMVNFKNGTFFGTNIDVANMLARAVGKKVKFVYCPFARCLSMTKDGKADMMVAINKTAQRMQYLDYLKQPFSSKITPVRFYQKLEDKIEINSYNDLYGLTIGVLRGASYFKQFDNDTKLNKVEITTHKQLIDMLSKGRIDTFLGRELSIKKRVGDKRYYSAMKIAPFIYTKNNDFYIAISKKSSKKVNVDQLSHTLDNLLADGSISLLFN